jgi:hypothetical protein
MVKLHLKAFTSACESSMFLSGGRCERYFCFVTRGVVKKISGDKNPAHWCIVFLSPLLFILSGLFIGYGSYPYALLFPG